MNSAPTIPQELVRRLRSAAQDPEALAPMRDLLERLQALELQVIVRAENLAAIGKAGVAAEARYHAAVLRASTSALQQILVERESKGAL